MTKNVYGIGISEETFRITVRQRALLHLRRFEGFDGLPCISAPRDLTQDGIADAAGVTRAHISIVLKKEVLNGNIEYQSAHTDGGRCKRHAYALTQKGRKEADLLLSQLRHRGIKTENVINTDRCSPRNWWNQLSEEDRDTFGKACVLRIKVPRNVLPGTKAVSIPTSREGTISIPESVRAEYVSYATEERRMAWHRWAADYYRNERKEEFGEIIYHLTNCGRMREACRLAVNHRDEMLAHPCDRTYINISKLVPESPNTSAILELKTELALETLRFSDAKNHAWELMQYEKGRGTTYLARTALCEMHAAAALHELSDVMKMDSSPDYSITSAEASVALGDIEKALDFLDRAKDRVYRTGDRHDMDRILVLRSLIAKAMGDDVMAAAHLMDSGGTMTAERQKMVFFTYLAICEMFEKATGKKLINRQCSF